MLFVQAPRERTDRGIGSVYVFDAAPESGSFGAFIKLLLSPEPYANGFGDWLETDGDNLVVGQSQGSIPENGRTPSQLSIFNFDPEDSDFGGLIERISLPLHGIFNSIPLSYDPCILLDGRKIYMSVRENPGRQYQHAVYVFEKEAVAADVPSIHRSSNATGESAVAPPCYNVVEEGVPEGLIDPDKVETWPVLPGKDFKLWYHGRKNSRISLQLELVSNTGGHYHDGGTRDPRVVGRIDPTNFVLPKSSRWRYPVTYRATKFCGVIKLISRFVGPDDGKTEVHVDYFDVGNIRPAIIAD